MRNILTCGAIHNFNKILKSLVLYYCCNYQYEYIYSTNHLINYSNKDIKKLNLPVVTCNVSNKVKITIFDFISAPIDALQFQVLLLLYFSHQEHFKVTETTYNICMYAFKYFCDCVKLKVHCKLDFT